MNAHTEVTAQNLRLIRGSRGMNQDQVADILGLKGYHVSNIEKGKRELSSSEASLLNLYFFDRMPFDIVGEKLLNSVLDFTEDQWKVICLLAKRQGITPGIWIANQIRSYLAMDDEAKSERLRIEQSRQLGKQEIPPLHELPRVAEYHRSAEK